MIMPEPYHERRRIGRDELDALFAGLGRALAKPLTAWDIGGSPMVYRGLKAGTKDADLVVDSPRDRDLVRDVLVRDGYRDAGFLPGYEGMEGILLRRTGQLGVDLFVHRIMEGFRLTPSMKKRADGPATFDNLRIFHCANEDIFLLKAITHRPDDDQDVLVLAGTGLDAKVMQAEVRIQQRLSGDNWPWKVFHALEAIEERTGVAIPIKSDLVE